MDILELNNTISEILKEIIIEWVEWQNVDKDNRGNNMNLKSNKNHTT